MKKYKNFEELEAELNFNTRAGFTVAPKQIESIEQCATWQRLANFSEVGCGKTVMATATSYLKGIATTVVAMPPILLPQWQEWLLRFTPSVCRYQGTPKYRGGLKLADYRWIIMSHAIFRQDFKRIYAELNRDGLELVIDEAQALKSPSSVLYKYVSRLVVGHDLQLLTGTPTNKPLDGYSYIKLKTPEVYRSVGHFENVHVAGRDFFGQPTGYQNLDLLAKNLAMQTVKHTKEEMFGYDLTPIYTPIPYDLHPAHSTLYETLVDEQLLLLKDGTKIDATTAQKLYHALQQIVCNWSHFSGDPCARSAIYDLVDEVVEETDCLKVERSKLIIWTYYKMTSRSMVAYCNQKWPGSSVAAYSEVDSARSVESFMKNPNTRILVAQPSSAGMGLNPAHLCSEALFIEASTNVMHMRQSCGRIDRKGQKVRPTIRFAQAVGTIQKALYKRLFDNDDLVIKVENLKDSLRKNLLGKNG